MDIEIGVVKGNAWRAAKRPAGNLTLQRRPDSVAARQCGCLQQKFAFNRPDNDEGFSLQNLIEKLVDPVQ
eukprot:1027022-Pyramimonas_sp.AAC.1